MLLKQLALLTGIALLNSVEAQSGAACNITNPCSSDAPCCSEFGFCGTDSFCLGGCNPLTSNSLDSCMPRPVCESFNHTFADNSRIHPNATEWGGNATAYDWTLDKGDILNTNSSGGELGMLLTETNGGTRLSSTRYVHYGNITAQVKTGRWAGVVTAFITMSDIKDEIDWEFPGANTTSGQSNFFWQGNIPATTAGEVHNGLTDTFDNYHDFTISWMPDTLTWLVDGKVVRTLSRTSAVQNGVSQYPDTPSRVQLSLWPAGINTSAAGTVQWAGGMINWNDPDYVSAGHFYALVKSVSVTCLDASPASPNSSVTSYVYGSNTTTDTPSVAFSDETTINAARTIFGDLRTNLSTLMLMSLVAFALM